SCQLHALCVRGDALIIRSTGGPSSAVQTSMHFACLVGEGLHVLTVQLVDVGREGTEVTGGDVHFGGSPWVGSGFDGNARTCADQPTTTVPVMKGWKEQMYVNVPAVSNSTVAVLPGWIAPA